MTWLPLIAVLAVTALVYVPTLSSGFVDFDDQTNLVENPYFRGLGPTALRWMFTHLEGHYIPLTWLSFAIDHQLWGMNPTGYHLTNLLLHLANAAVFYLVSLELLRAALAPRLAGSPALRVGAVVAAALFALHPMRVESVAWATERRDVLSGLFVLLTLWSYLRAHRPPPTDVTSARARFPTAALVWYVLSLLAKPVGMTVPLVLLVLDVYPLRRMRSVRAAVWIEKLPFVVLGIGTAVVEGVAESRLDTFYSLREYGLGGRIGQAFYALAFYVMKTLVPVGLSPLYPIPVGWSFGRSDVLAAVAFVAVTTTILVWNRRRWPWAVAAWASFVVLLAPVLGIAQAGPHIAADRYTYLATLGCAVVYGGVVATLGARGEQGRYRVALAITALVVVALAAVTSRQVHVWHDSIALWERAVSVDPDCYVCRNNMGNALLRADRGAEAAPHFQAALNLQPADADAYANLGNIAEREGRPADAARYFDQAIRIDPTHPVAHNNVARRLIDEGKAAEAVRHLEIALRREPMQGESRINLGLALLDAGDLDGAVRELELAGKILPDWPAVPNNLGIVRLRRDDAAGALAEFRRASGLDPQFAEARYNEALALDALGRRDDAIAALEAAVGLRADYVAAHVKLSQLLRDAGRLDESRSHLDVALRASPDGTTGMRIVLQHIEAGRRRDAIDVLERVRAQHPSDFDAVNLLAWLLATAPEAELRDGKTAVELAQAAVAAPDGAADADRLDTLAAAYAESGRFNDALRTARQAERAARDSAQEDLALEIAARIAEYEAHRPFRGE